MIDGKETVEVDYSAMHAIIAYGEVGQVPPNKPYEFDDVYVSRNVVKKLFNSMLNASDKKIKREPCFNEDQTGISWDELQRKIKEKHAPIDKLFYSGCGVKFQYLDAQIAEDIMLHYGESGYPCLPVHDSFLVHWALREELDTVMKEVFKKHINFDVDVRTTEKGCCAYKLVNNAEEFDVKQNYLQSFPPIDELINPTDPSEKRLLDWREFKNKNTNK